MNQQLSYRGLAFTGSVAPSLSILGFSLLGMPGLLLGTGLIIGAGIYIGRHKPEDLVPPALTVAAGSAVGALPYTLLAMEEGTSLFYQLFLTFGRMAFWTWIAAWITRAFSR